MESGKPERRVVPIPGEKEALKELVDENRILDAQLGLKEWEMEERARQVGIDSLTGVKNRTTFQKELADTLRFVRGESDPHRAGIEPINELSLLFIDLDNFGEVNKKLGHGRGDDVLVRAVNIIKNSIRETDILGRFGGDEFYVLLPRASQGIAESRAGKILADIQADEQLRELGVGASIGVCSTLNSTDPSELVEYADEAARKAKQGGKNRIEIYGV